MSALIACMGGACTDHVVRPTGPVQRDGEVTAQSASWYGGVALNVAENLQRIGVPAALVTRIGDDDAGNGLLAHARRAGIDVAGVEQAPGDATAAYLAILENGVPLYAFSDMRIFEGFTRAVLDRAWPAASKARIVFADTNLPCGVLTELARRRGDAAFRYVLGVSSVPTAGNVPQRLAGVDLLFMNEAEAAQYLGVTAISAPDAVSALIARGAAAVVVTRGRAGCVVGDPEIAAIPSVPATVVDTTGAGDALIAGTLAELLAGAPVRDAVRAGSVLAAITVETLGTVSATLSRSVFEARRRVAAAS
jgi:pseudouridine kinase